MSHANESSGAFEGAGHESARPLEDLFSRHRPALEAYLRRRVGRRLRTQESFSDLTQSVCREILVDAEQLDFDDERAFRGLLMKAADRKIVERHRYHHRAKRDVDRTHIVADVDSFEAARAREPTPSQAAADQEQSVQLQHALEALPGEYRDVLLMAHGMGMSHAEMAARLGRSEVASRKLLSRALARLATIMKTRRLPTDHLPDRLADEIRRQD